MKLRVIEEDVALSSTSDGSAIDLASVAPFLIGATAIAEIGFSAAADGTPVATLQTSPDNSTWTTVLTKTGLKATKKAEITLARYIRRRVTTASTTTGHANFYLTGAY